MHLFKIPITGLNSSLFMAHGEDRYGTDDFTDAILKENPIRVFNKGEMYRDFTFIEDVIEATFRCCYKTATDDLLFDFNNPDPSISSAPFKIFNVGNQSNIKLLKFIEILENSIGKKAKIDLHDMQLGDVKNTFADTNNSNWINYMPSTPIEGVLINLLVGIKIIIKFFNICIFIKIILLFYFIFNYR